MRIQILILGFKGLRGINRPFYRYGSHIELLRFKEYYGLPMGHEHHRTCLVLEIWLSFLFSQEKGHHQRSFFPLQSN